MKIVDFQFSVWQMLGNGRKTLCQVCADEFDAMQVRFLLKKEHPENIYEIFAKEV